jgi:hypothetical protein
MPANALKNKVNAIMFLFYLFLLMVIDHWFLEGQSQTFLISHSLVHIILKIHQTKKNYYYYIKTMSF